MRHATYPDPLPLWYGHAPGHPSPGDLSQPPSRNPGLGRTDRRLALSHHPRPPQPHCHTLYVLTPHLLLVSYILS